MKFIKVIAVVVLSTVISAGPSAKSEIESKDDGEPLSISLVMSKDQFKGNLIQVNHKTIEIKPGKSLIQEQEEKAAAEAEAKKQEEIKKASRNVVAREVSPGKTYDPAAKIIMADTAYRDSYGRSNCVTFATRYTGIYKRLGYGVTIASEGSNPQVGAIALDRYRGHAAVVVAVEGRILTLWDSNWIKGYVTERKVDISSQRGYIYK